MKAVIGIFDKKDDVKTAVETLKESGFSEDDLALITSYQAEEVRDVLNEELERAVVTGAIVGSGIGSTLGLLGSVVLLPVPGAGPMLASGLVATVASGVLGGYLGTIYATRAADQPEHELKEALGEGNVLLLVEIDDEAALENQARLIMDQAGGSYLETHEITPEAIAGLTD